VVGCPLNAGQQFFNFDKVVRQHAIGRAYFWRFVCTTHESVILLKYWFQTRAVVDREGQVRFGADVPIMASQAGLSTVF
jgi:hypothetical protein